MCTHLIISTLRPDIPQLSAKLRRLEGMYAGQAAEAAWINERAEKARLHYSQVQRRWQRRRRGVFFFSRFRRTIQLVLVTMPVRGLTYPPLPVIGGWYSAIISYHIYRPLLASQL